MKNQNLTRLVIGLALLVLLLAITMSTQIGKEKFENEAYNVVVTEITPWRKGQSINVNQSQSFQTSNDNSTVSIVSGEATGAYIDWGKGTKNWRWMESVSPSN